MVASLLSAVVALAGMATNVVAIQAQLSVPNPIVNFNFSTPVTQCRGITVRWSGGKPPFNIHIVPMSYGNGIQPFNISTGVTDEPFEYTWNLEWPAGAPFLMTMTDESGWGSAPVSDIIIPERGQSTCMKLQGIFAEGMGFAFGITPGDEERHPQCSPHYITWSPEPNPPVPPINVYGVLANGTAWVFPPVNNISDQIDWALDLPVGGTWNLFAKDQNATGLFQGGWLTKLPVDPPVDAAASSCVRPDSPRFIKLASPAAKTGSTGGISGGAIGGIVAAIVVVALLIAGALAWWFLRRRKRAANRSPGGSLTGEGGFPPGSGGQVNTGLLDDGEAGAKYPTGHARGYDDDKLAPTPFVMQDGRTRNAYNPEPRASMSGSSQGQPAYPGSDAGYSDTALSSVGGRSAPNTLSAKLADERKNMMAAGGQGQFGEIPVRHGPGDHTDLLQSILANQQALSAALSEAAHVHAPPPMYEDGDSHAMAAAVAPPNPQSGYSEPAGLARPGGLSPAPVAQGWRPDVKAPRSTSPGEMPLSGPSAPHSGEPRPPHPPM